MAEISSPQITVSTASGGEAASTVSSSGNQITEEFSIPVATTKKKRNQPGNPDPDAEVVALSPTSLLATNRFLCEICGKGFQRDQNLQLHRRGHNLPWKLRQRTSKEIKKRVYVCPEISCVHHDPKRALGDLTGIKKHFCRKHGEKKFKCERCCKKYAVQSDWKAHMKTCGSKEYKCDCGTVFSRRDSFVTHRAFCDALAQESAKSQVQVLSVLGTEHKDVMGGDGDGGGASGGVDALAPSGSAAAITSPPEATPFSSVLSPVLSVHGPDVPEHQSTGFAQPTSAGCSSSNSTSNANGPFPSIFAPVSGVSLESPAPSQPSYSNMFTPVTASGQEPSTFLLGSSMEPTSLSLSSIYRQLSNHNAPYINQTSSPHDHMPFASQQPAMSATALLQKAAQMGATTSGSSMLNGFGLASASSHCQHESNVVGPSTRWNSHVVSGRPENGRSVDGLGGGLPSDSEFMSSPGQVMGGFPGFYDSKPTTLDLLGLGIGGNDTTSGLPPFFTSINHGFGAADSGGGGGDSFGCGVNPWENLTSERKSHETML